jgi:hypothetical protein
VKTLPVNTTDQSSTLQSAIDSGERIFSFSAGPHRFRKTLERIQPGTKFVGQGVASLDFGSLPHGMWLQGSLSLENLTLSGDFLLATGNGGTPSISFDRVVCNVETTIQNLATVSAVGSSFSKQTYWHNAVVSNCSFSADTNISGNTQFTDNRMIARLICGSGTWGLSNARVSRIRWDGLISRDNVAECLLFECVDVTDSEFSDLDFINCTGPLIEYWDIGGDGVPQNHRFRNNTIRNILSSGPTCVGIYLAGNTENTLIEDVILSRTTQPVVIDPTSNNTTVRRFMITSPEIAPYADDQRFTRAWKLAMKQLQRFLVTDNGTGTVLESLYVDNPNGTTVCNRPLRAGESIEVN